MNGYEERVGGRGYAGGEHLPHRPCPRRTTLSDDSARPRLCAAAERSAGNRLGAAHSSLMRLRSTYAKIRYWVLSWRMFQRRLTCSNGCSGRLAS